MNLTNTFGGTYMEQHFSIVEYIETKFVAILLAIFPNALLN